MLTADAYGVLPPIARLTPDGAMYHFLSGYTARVAGTEKGVTEPKATFSTCFGAPFLPLNPNVYASMLGKKIAEHGVRVWLVNTGWTGGPYGVGRRMTIAYTRAMITAALAGAARRGPVSATPDLQRRYADDMSGRAGRRARSEKYLAGCGRNTTRRRARSRACSSRISRHSNPTSWTPGMTGGTPTRLLTTSMFVLKLAEEILSADEVVVEDPPRRAQELRNQRIAHGVPDTDTFLAPGNDVVGTQDGELLRHDRLLHAQCVLQLLHVLLPVHEEFEHPDSDRMRERLEERRLKCLKLLGGHVGIDICILHSLHVSRSAV